MRWLQLPAVVTQTLRATQYIRVQREQIYQEHIGSEGRRARPEERELPARMLAAEPCVA